MLADMFYSEAGKKVREESRTTVVQIVFNFFNIFKLFIIFNIPTPYPLSLPDKRCGKIFLLRCNASLVKIKSLQIF